MGLQQVRMQRKSHGVGQKEQTLHAHRITAMHCIQHIAEHQQEPQAGRGDCQGDCCRETAPPIHNEALRRASNKWTILPARASPHSIVMGTRRGDQRDGNAECGNHGMPHVLLRDGIPRQGRSRIGQKADEVYEQQHRGIEIAGPEVHQPGKARKRASSTRSPR